MLQTIRHIVGLIALCTGTYTHKFSKASGHSIHSWAYRSVYRDMNSVERDNNNPCSVVSHHESFDAIVMMFGVSVPVLLETQHVHSTSSLMDANLVLGSQTHPPHHVTSLISWTFARAVLNSWRRLYSICDISLVGFTCKLGPHIVGLIPQCTETRTHWFASQQTHSPSLT